MSHESSPTPAALPFSPAEIESFHRADRSAAGAVVVLMSGIFSLGLVGYTSVCLWIVS